jgi:hypothetical protein
MHVPVLLESLRKLPPHLGGKLRAEVTASALFLCPQGALSFRENLFPAIWWIGLCQRGAKGLKVTSWQRERTYTTISGAGERNRPYLCLR